MFVHRIIKKIWVHPGTEIWRFEIEWLWGARTNVSLMTHFGIGDQLDRAWANGAMPEEIAASLSQRGAVRRTGLQAGEPYSPEVVRDFVRKHRLQRPFDDQALAYIPPRVEAGATYSAISDELTKRGIRHYLGSWTARRVGYVVRRLRRRHIANGQSLRKIPPIDDAVQRLHTLRLAVPEIVAHLPAQGVVNRRRRPVTAKNVCRALRRLGLRPRSTLDNEQLEELLTEWTPTTTLPEITRRVNAFGLRTRRGTRWTYNAIFAKVAALGLQAAKKERVRDRAGRFAAEKDAAGARDDEMPVQQALFESV